MKPSRAKTPLRTPGRLARFNSQPPSEEVSVFCRVRPLAPGGGSDVSAESDDGGARCVEVIDDVTLRVSPPESSRNFYSGKAADYTFKRVFDEESGQREVFQTCGLSLVKELLAGKNGLLFTYGVTGSGKTYTMQGSPSDGGVMSRAVDVIFNSLEGRLTSRKYLIEPDKLNDFQMQSVADAAARQQREMVQDMKTRGYTTRSNTSDRNLSNRLPDETIVDDVDRNKVYAVFISYCEVYNKYIYDLLEDTMSSKHRFESKSLREDAHGNMFVYGATEVEVRSPREALELFYKGQKRRRVAQTQLNFESSRSHSIFNIRLVKCSPADADEVDDAQPCLVSQLALVDLAGSERTSRTGNTGDRLREAGNINNSLMNLRTCIERLRENQRSGGKNAANVPYRNDKITHLFRNYFEGVGAVKMIVNVNPRAADYEETVNVLQFAEMAQEVEIERRFDPVAREFAVTPGRQRAREAYEAALNRAETGIDVNKLNPAYSVIYSLGPAFPSVEWQGLEDEETLPALDRYLEQRIATRNTLLKDHSSKQEQFRQRLVEAEKELILLREENGRLKAGWEGEKRRTRDLETRLVNAESANTSLQRRVEAFCDAKVVLENELDERELELNQQKKETKKIERALRRQKSSGDTDGDGSAPMTRKRSWEVRNLENAEDEENRGAFKGVGSRIAEMEARCSKKLRH